MFRKRSVYIMMLAGIFLLIAGACYLLPEDKTPEPVRVAMKNTGGTVVFEHQKHVALKLDCVKCHHDIKSKDETVAACKSCHGVTFDKTFVAEHTQAFSADKCATCHHYIPGATDWGHAKHAEEYGLECSSCHHADPNIEPEPMNCADCHEAGKAPSKQAFEAGVAPSFADAVHAKCASCHQEWFDLGARGCFSCHFDKKEGTARLHKNLDTMTCTACHSEGVDKLIPNRMDAFHTSCMNCHKEMKKGPFASTDCAQCHIK